MPFPFSDRHIGPRSSEIKEMLSNLEYPDLETFCNAVVPENIQSHNTNKIIEEKSEPEIIIRLKELANKNEVFKSWIGMGYHGTNTPTVVLRNILENPG